MTRNAFSPDASIVALGLAPMKMPLPEMPPFDVAHFFFPSRSLVPGAGIS
jgi:hypothetical protein